MAYSITVQKGGPNFRRGGILFTKDGPTVVDEVSDGLAKTLELGARSPLQAEETDEDAQYRLTKDERTYELDPDWKPPRERHDAPEPEPDDSEDDLAEFSRAELLDRAEARGVEVPSGATKPEIKELLETAAPDDG